MSETWEQVSLLEDLDREAEDKEEMRVKLIRNKLEDEYRRVSMGQINRNYHTEETLPLGTVVIIEEHRRVKDREVIHFYRTILGQHNTVSGPAAHLTEAQNREWPEKPGWMENRDGKPRWIYPSGLHMLWTRGEMEADHAEA